VGLLLSTMWAGNIDWQWRVLAPSSISTASWHSAANTGSVMLTAKQKG